MSPNHRIFPPTFILYQLPQFGNTFPAWYFEVICSQVSGKLTKQKLLPETDSLSWPYHYWANIQRLFFMQIHVPNHIYTCAHSPVLHHSVESQIRDYMVHLRGYSFWNICVLLIINIRVYKEKQGVILYPLWSSFVLIPSPLNTAVKGNDYSSCKHTRTTFKLASADFLHRAVLTIPVAAKEYLHIQNFSC